MLSHCYNNMHNTHIHNVKPQYVTCLHLHVLVKESPRMSGKSHCSSLHFLLFSSRGLQATLSSRDPCVLSLEGRRQHCVQIPELIMLGSCAHSTYSPASSLKLKQEKALQNQYRTAGNFVESGRRQLADICNKPSGCKNIGDNTENPGASLERQRQQILTELRAQALNYDTSSQISSGSMK